jgi:hypothetical protein
MGENRNQNDPQELSWIRRAKSSPIALLVTALVAFLGWLALAVENGGKIWDRFSTPQAFVLAENTAKASFSEQLVQRAWRRLFWARLFTSGVAHKVTIEDINDAWKHYIDADADWNANVMLSIVGLETHYDMNRSRNLEFGILPAFASLDKILAELRRSETVEHIRDGKEVTASEMEVVNRLVTCSESATWLLNEQFYMLSRCFAPDDPSMKNICSSDMLNSSDEDKLNRCLENSKHAQSAD